MNTQIILGIIIMVLGSGIGTYLIQKGGAKQAFKNNEKLINYINSLDSKSRSKILNNSNLNKDEIILLVNNQTKSSAVDIISEVQDKFGIINEELIEKEKKIQELEKNEAERVETEKQFEILKRTSPDVDFEMRFKGNDLVIDMKFNNKVPIVLHPKIHAFGPWEAEDPSKNYQIFRSAQHDLHHPKIYPPADLNEKVEFVFDSITKDEKLPFEKHLAMRMNITYSSIYYDEIKMPDLKDKKVTLDYIIEANTKKFIKTKFKEN